MSRGVEYAMDDFGLYQVALGEGDDEAIAKYWRQSQNWRNYWNSDENSLGFQGFLSPRDENGFFPHGPLQWSGYWPDLFY